MIIACLGLFSIIGFLIWFAEDTKLGQKIITKLMNWFDM